MSVESGSFGIFRIRGLRLALAALLTLSVVTATVLLWNPSPPEPIDPVADQAANEALAADSLEHDAPEAGPLRVDQLESPPTLEGRFPHPPRHPNWRAITGTTRREDTGWPVKCWFTPLDPEEQPLEVETRSILAGTFHVLIPPEAETLRVSARSAFDLQDVQLNLPKESGLTGVNVVLPTANGLLKGQVVDHAGSGLAGVRIDLNGRYAHRMSGPSGAFHFRPLRDGQYLVSVADVAFAEEAPNSIQIVLKQGIQQEPALFVVLRGAAIRGVVRSQATTQPLDRVRILLGQESDTDQHRTQLTDDHGRFVFERLNPGSYVVTANTDDGVHGRIRLPVPDLKDAENRKLSLELRPGAGSLKGQLVDAGKTPVPFASVVASLESEGQVTTRTDTRGQFAFRSLAPGIWTIGLDKSYCESNNWITGESPQVEIRAGEAANLELQIQKGAFLEGQIISESERGGLRIRMRLPSGSVLEEAAGAEGRFAFGGLGGGTYFLEVVDPSMPEGSAMAQQTVLIAGAQPERVVFRVP